LHDETRVKFVGGSRQSIAFQLQSLREFGLMCDCVAAHLHATALGLSETNESTTLGEYL
jgi:hypothetical protein